MVKKKETTDSLHNKIMGKSESETIDSLHEKVMEEAKPTTDTVQKFSYSDVKTVDTVKVMGKTIAVNYTTEYTNFDGKKTLDKRTLEFQIVPQDSYVKTEDVQKLFNSMINGK